MIKKIVLWFFLALVLHAESLPLEGRKYGVEFNFPRLLTYSDSWKSISGTFSYFDHDEKIEIAVPWLIARHQNRYDSDNYDVKTIDVHYRKFLEDRLSGFYISGFTRLAYIDGRLQDENMRQKTLKLGIGVGLGVRILPENSRFYWGFGLYVGRYLGNQNEIYKTRDFDFLIYDDIPIIVDFDFLKFGYAF